MGEGEGEEINNEGRGGSQGQSHALFATMDKEGWSVRAEDFYILIPPSLGRAEGEWQQGREGQEQILLRVN